ncbi:MAG: valine--tRNA ligase [Bacteroides sp.]|nr:valine--tRNA ligase [Ruminococcus flavefaciens]MCM1554972.1 valine--tRNA ligase [Bacteroides sp.]
MAELSSKYDPRQIEDKWYAYWLKNNFFHSEPDGREAYCVVIPPPNVTGILHMGHMLNNTIQDVLVRRARMQGKNACWVPGMDHASIATEAKVVSFLKEKGIEKNSLTREKFLEHAWEWKEKYGGIILSQLRKLGASCDWERTRFTMDEICSESVLDIFVNLYQRGLIYRGVRMVNWDPKAKTALSDEEVLYKETKGSLYYLRYYVKEEPQRYITVATTRPETIMGDTAVCINPTDERYADLKGKHVIVPLVNREVPVIFDEYVDKEFGTGCLKITPAHDINDYNIGQKYKLDSIDVFNDDGTLNEHGGKYAGMDRFTVRREIAIDLKHAGLLEKEEEYVNNVGYSERTNVAIEPKLSMQWFLKMGDLAKPALEAVMNDRIVFVPAKLKNTYRHWMENIKDWCISRQLWWGHRIPAYYLPNREVVVAKSAQEALEAAKKQYPEAASYTLADLKQDEDVLDTWFSSWLWPIEVFDGVRRPDNEEINYYYPTADLVTAPDIIFFWVSRMIMAGLDLRKEIPFRHVYFTGTVRDKLGRKMSKSLGNSPDPLELMDKYGTDGVRVGMLLTSPAGNDLPFDESLCEQGRNFCNKIWNALRLIKGWSCDASIAQPQTAQVACRWFEARLLQALQEVEDNAAKYRLSEALMQLYRLTWDDFCSWFLEMIKPAYGEPIDAKTLQCAVGFMETLMQALHPFMPFITEEIWQVLGERKEGQSVMFQPLPKAAPDQAQQQLLQEFAKAEEVIMGIRALRNEKNIPQKNPLKLLVKAENSGMGAFEGLVSKLCNIESVAFVKEAPQNVLSFVVGGVEYFVPMEGNVDAEAERERIEKELEYTRGFLQSVLRKLENKRFVDSAPKAVVDAEYKKRADAEQKISVLEAQLQQLAK